MTTMLDDLPPGVPGWRIEQRYPNLTYPAGRICSVESCSTLLSRYNSGDVCGVHEHGYGDDPSVPSHGLHREAGAMTKHHHEESESEAFTDLMNQEGEEETKDEPERDED